MEIAVSLLVGALVLLAGYAVYTYIPQILRRLDSDLPAREVESIIRIWAMRAIIAGYKASEEALNTIDKKLSGADKKQIADSLYALIPDSIHGYDVSIVKRFIPKERFEVIVQDVYDEFDTFFDMHHEKFRQIVVNL